MQNQQSLPSTNAHSEQQHKPLQNSTSSGRNRNAQLAALITQSFDIFNVYGKEPEALKNIIQGFSVALQNHDMQDIQAAFGQWLREKPNMPQPCDIGALAADWKRFRLSRRRSMSVPTTNAPSTSGDYRVNGYTPVSWAFKHFAEFTLADFDDLRQHLAGMTEPKKTNYENYLIKTCGFPKDWR